MNIGILGLGLIGGSLARDLAAKGHHMVGFDADPRQQESATADRVVQELLPGDLDGIEKCNVIVLATPIDSAISLLQQVAPRTAAAKLVMDVGSTKRSIVEAAERLEMVNFVGAHPLAGDHRSGWLASVRGLFADARVFLCPASVSSEAALAAARDLWLLVGARPEVLDAAAHDEMLAFSSHLPQVLSSVLGHTLASRGVPRTALGPGGLDVTRLAGSDATLWSGILADNSDHVRVALAETIDRLSTLHSALGAENWSTVREMLQVAGEWSRARKEITQSGVQAAGSPGAARAG